MQDEGRKFGQADAAQQNTFNPEAVQHAVNRRNGELSSVSSSMQYEQMDAAARAAADAKYAQQGQGGHSQPQARRTQNGQNASPDGQEQAAQQAQQQQQQQQQQRQGVLGTFGAMVNELLGRKAEEIQAQQGVQQDKLRVQSATSVVSQPAPQRSPSQRAENGLGQQNSMQNLLKPGALDAVAKAGGVLRGADVTHAGKAQEAPQTAKSTPGQEQFQAQKQAREAQTAPTR